MAECGLSVAGLRTPLHSSAVYRQLSSRPQAAACACKAGGRETLISESGPAGTPSAGQRNESPRFVYWARICKHCGVRGDLCDDRTVSRASFGLSGPAALLYESEKLPSDKSPFAQQSVEFVSGSQCAIFFCEGPIQNGAGRRLQNDPAGGARTRPSRWRLPVTPSQLHPADPPVEATPTEGLRRPREANGGIRGASHPAASGDRISASGNQGSDSGAQGALVQALMHRGDNQAQMKRGLWSNNRDVGTTEGRRKPIEERSNADVLASWWPDWNRAPVVAVPQLFIEVYLTTAPGGSETLSVLL